MASQVSTKPTTTITTTPTTTAQPNICDAMVFSSLNTEPAALEASAPEFAAEMSVLEPSFTPKGSSPPNENEPHSPAETITAELTDENGGCEDTEQPTVDIFDDDSIEREFICMNDEYSKCRTGQYTLELSRKVISDHFGRNKSCTRDLTDWPLFCRKHYQRATYNKELWQMRKVKLILRQFNVIEAKFPGTMYDITLKKSEEDRLNEFSRKIASGMSVENAAAAVAPVSGKAFEAPIDVLRELDQYIGKHKPMQNAKDAMDVIFQMLQEKETDQVPSIEFLPKLPGKASTLNKSPSKSPSKGSTRTSARGSVKKANKQA